MKPSAHEKNAETYLSNTGICKT